MFPHCHLGSQQVFPLKQHAFLIKWQPQALSSALLFWFGWNVMRILWISISSTFVCVQEQTVCTYLTADFLIFCLWLSVFFWSSPLYGSSWVACCSEGLSPNQMVAGLIFVIASVSYHNSRKTWGIHAPSFKYRWAVGLWPRRPERYHFEWVVVYKTQR